MTTKPPSAIGDRPGTAARRPPTWAGCWYFVLTVVSLGLLAWVPFVHAAVHLRSGTARALAVGYAVAAFAIVVLISSTPTDTADMTAADNVVGMVAGLLMSSVVISALMTQSVLRRQVYGTHRDARSRRRARRAAVPTIPFTGRR